MVESLSSDVSQVNLIDDSFQRRSANELHHSLLLRWILKHICLSREYEQYMPFDSAQEV